MTENLDVTGEDDKALAPTAADQTAWNRSEILLHLQNLARNAPESSVRLKCLEHLLENSATDDENPRAHSFREAANRARRKVHGEE